MSRTTPPPPTASSKHVIDLLAAMGSKVFYALTRVALPPLVLSHVSLSEYGLWAASFVLVSYLGMSASGFTNVYLRQVAQCHAKADMQGISRLLSTGIFTMCSISALLLGCLYLALPHLLTLFGVQPAMRDLATMLWMGAAGIFMADISFAGFSNTLHALGRIRDDQKIWLSACCLELALIVGFLQLGWGIQGMLWAFALRYAFSGFSAMRKVLQHLPGVRITWRHFDRALLPAFLLRGGSFQLADMLGTALHSFDRLIAGALLGPQATAAFDLAAKLPLTAASAPSSLNTITASIAARHDANADAQAGKTVFFDALRMNVLTLGVILPFMSAFSAHFAQAWMGAAPAIAPLLEVLPIICLGMHWHMLTGPASAMFRGLGRVGPDYLYHSSRIICFALSIATWYTLSSTSLRGLAWAIALAQTCAGILYAQWAYRQIVGSRARYVTSCIVPTLIAYGLAYALQSAAGTPHGTDRLQALLELAALGTIWLALVGILAWHGLLQSTERARLSGWAQGVKNATLCRLSLHKHYTRIVTWRRP